MPALFLLAAPYMHYTFRVSLLFTVGSNKMNRRKLAQCTLSLLHIPVCFLSLCDIVPAVAPAAKLLPRDLESNNAKIDYYIKSLAAAACDVLKRTPIIAWSQYVSNVPLGFHVFNSFSAAAAVIKGSLNYYCHLSLK